MAKKNDPFEQNFTIDDEWDGGNLDDIDSMFANIGDDSGAKTKSAARKAVELTATTATSALKGATTGIVGDIGREISNNAPNIGRVADEAMGFIGGLGDIKQEILKNTAELTTQSKQLLRSLSPRLNKILPDKLKKKLDEFTKEEEQPHEETAEERRNREISEEITKALKVQVVRDAAENEERRLNTLIDRKITEKQHKSTIDVLNIMKRHDEFRTQFYKTTVTGYFSKSLELKYKQLFISKDILATLQVMAKSFDNKLAAVVKNTALPDIQKQKLTETYKQTARNALSNRFNDVVSKKFSSLLDPNKSGLKDLITGTISNVGMMMMQANMAKDQIGMMSEMGGGDEMSPAKMGAELGGEFGGEFLGTWLLSKMLPRDKREKFIKETSKNLDAKVSGFRTKALIRSKNFLRKQFNKGMQLDDDLSEKKIGKVAYAKGKLKQGVIGGLINALGLGEFGGDEAVQNDFFKDPKKRVDFDVATRQSIVEVIPRYLAKILQQVTMLNTGKPAAELTYDAKRRDFITTDQYQKEMVTLLHGEKEKRTGEAIAKGISSIQTGLQRNGKLNDRSLNFDKARGDIQKIIRNLSAAKEDIDPEEIKAFVDSGQKLDDKEINKWNTAFDEKYIKTVFKGIKNPEKAAKLLVHALYDKDGKENTLIVESFRDALVSAMDDDKYKKYLGELVDSGKGFLVQDYFDHSRKPEDVDKKRNLLIDQAGIFDKYSADYNKKLYGEKYAYFQKDLEERLSGNRSFKDDLKELAPDKLQEWMGWAKAKGEGLQASFTGAVDAFNQSRFGGLARDARSTAGNYFTQGKDYLTGKGQSLWESLQGMYGDNKQRVLDYYTANKDGAKQYALDKFGVARDYLGNALHTGGQYALDKFNGVDWRGYGDRLSGMAGTGRQYLTDKFNGVDWKKYKDEISGMATTGKNYLTGKWDGFDAQGMLADGKQFITDKTGLTRDSFSKQNLLSTKDALLSTAMTKVSAASTAATEQLAILRQEMKTTALAQMATVRGMAEGKIDPEVWKNMVSSVAEVGSTKVQGVQSAVTSKIGKLKVPSTATLAKWLPRVTKGALLVGGLASIAKAVTDPQKLMKYGILGGGMLALGGGKLGLSLLNRGRNWLKRKRGKDRDIFDNIGDAAKGFLSKRMPGLSKKFEGLKGMASQFMPGMAGMLGGGGGQDTPMGMMGMMGQMQSLPVVGKLEELLEYFKNKDKPVFGDADGDGDREGSYQDYMQKKADKLKDAVQGVLPGKDKDKDKDLKIDAGDSGGGMFGTLLTMIGGRKLGRMFGKVARFFGGKLTSILKLITKVAGKGIFGLLGLLFGSGAIKGLTGATEALAGAGAKAAAGAGTKIAATGAAAMGAKALMGGGGKAAEAAGKGVEAASKAAGAAKKDGILKKIFKFCIAKFPAKLVKYILKLQLFIPKLMLKLGAKGLGKLAARFLTGPVGWVVLGADILYNGGKAMWNAKELIGVADNVDISFTDRFIIGVSGALANGLFLGLVDVTTIASMLGVDIEGYQRKGKSEKAKADELNEEVRNDPDGPNASAEPSGNSTANHKPQSDEVNDDDDEEKKFNDLMKGGGMVAELERASGNSNANVMSTQEQTSNMYGGGGVGPMASPQQQAINNRQDPALDNLKPVKPTLNGPDKLGAYVKEYESGKGGAMTVAWDSTGGTSYGTYQLAAKTGVFKEFMDMIQKSSNPNASTTYGIMKKVPKWDVGQNYKGTHPYETWRSLAKKGYIQDFEHEFTKKRYDNVLKLFPQDLQDAINGSRALQEMLWSTVVQHGPGGKKYNNGAYGIFTKCWKPGMKLDDFVRAVYAKRATQFGSSTPKVRASVQNRFKEECAKILGLLGTSGITEEGTSGNEDTAVAGVDSFVQGAKAALGGDGASGNSTANVSSGDTGGSSGGSPGVAASAGDTTQSTATGTSTANVSSGNTMTVADSVMYGGGGVGPLAAQKDVTNESADESAKDNKSGEGASAMASKAADIATKNAEGKSVGRCARYVANALQGAGYKFNRQGSAYQYTTNGIMEKMGFKPIGFNVPRLKGDVAVIGANKRHEHGHIQIWNGTTWVSDFKQNPNKLGPYRGGKGVESDQFLKIYRDTKGVPEGSENAGQETATASADSSTPAASTGDQSQYTQTDPSTGGNVTDMSSVPAGGGSGTATASNMAASNPPSSDGADTSAGASNSTSLDKLVDLLTEANKYLGVIADSTTGLKGLDQAIAGMNTGKNAAGAQGQGATASASPNLAPSHQPVASQSPTNKMAQSPLKVNALDTSRRAPVAGQFV